MALAQEPSSPDRWSLGNSVDQSHVSGALVARSYEKVFLGPRPRGRCHLFIMQAERKWPRTWTQKGGYSSGGIVSQLCRSGA